MRLKNGCCFDTIKTMEKKGIKIDCIITDPPYEISNSGGGMMDRDNRNFIKEIDKMGMCKSGFDVKKFLNSTIGLFETQNKFCGVFFCSMKQLSNYIVWAEENKLQVGVGVWHKTNPAPLCNFKYLNDLEYWVYIKGNKSKILGSYKTKSMMYSSPINKKDKKIYGHPTIKPIELIERFVENHSVAEQVVFDPFMGSGTTGVASVKMNRKFIGVELDKEYFDIAKGRIKGEQK